MNGWFVAGTSFVASGVEAVEALTIVLAVGVTRSWRVALGGTLAALAVLAVIAIVAGPLIGTRIPIVFVRFIAGAIALYLGFTWTRKAVLRASGRKAQRDETAAFEKQTSSLSREAIGGFATAYNGVFVEGVEVIVIVVSLGTASAGGLAPATLGALAAIAVVALLGLLLHQPLARVPENAMKWVVGVMLLSFGTFWLGEGIGIHWPLDDLALPIIVVVYALATFVALSVLRRSASPA
jgi:uncharacterized membrane protein